MANTTFKRVLAGVQDLLLGDSTTPASQVRTGPSGDQTLSITPVDSAVLPLSSASKTTLSLTGTKTVDDAISYFAQGSGLPTASTTLKGIGKVSVAPVSATVPIFVGDNDPRMLASASVAAAANGGQTPTSSNPFITQSSLNDQPDIYGTGKDGAFILGTITTPSTAVSGLSGTTGGGQVPAGTYSYKWTAGNITGETAMSSASSTVALASTGTITGTIPVGDANTAWRRLYRDDGTSTWRLVKHIPNNTDTTFTDTLPVGGASTTLGVLPSATWSNPSGEWHFNGDMTISSALTVATSGQSQGRLVIRCRGNVTISAAVSANACYPTSNHPLFAGQNVFSNGFSGTSGITYVSNPNTSVYPGKGFGTFVSGIGYQGQGGSGILGSGVSLGVSGGSAGGVIVIYAYGITVTGTGSVTATGGTGSNATVGTNQSASGGGGGAGGAVALFGRDYIYLATGSAVTANGGTGGNAANNGSSTGTAYGGNGGGGGWVFLVSPVVRNSGTATANSGAAGTNITSAYNSASAGPGGAHSGDSGNAGQVVTAGTVTGFFGYPLLRA